MLTDSGRETKVSQYCGASRPGTKVYGYASIIPPSIYKGDNLTVVNSGLTSHQQQGHTETGPGFKVSSERPEKRGR